MHLADEILLQILEHFSISFPEYKPSWENVPFPEELVTLARLCRSSRRLRGLAEPILYHAIPYDSKNRRLLWRTLVERPDLRALVKSIHLDSELPPNELTSLLEAARPSLDISEDLAEQLFADLRLGQDRKNQVEENESEDEDEDGEENEQYYRTRHVELQFAMLLLPKLDLVELASYYDLGPFMYDLFGSLRAGADTKAGCAPHLASLREVRIRNKLQEERLGLRPAGILALSHIQSLQAQQVYWNFHDIDRKYPGAYLSVRSIDLSDSICNGPALSDMLSRCPELRELRIEWGLSFDDWEDELDFGSIGDALRRHGQRLEWLNLDCREAYPYGYSDDDLGSIGSLRALVNLKRLTLTHDMLIGRDWDDFDIDEDTLRAETFRLSELLPVSLEELHFYSCQGDEEQLDDQLYDLIAPGGKHMGSLRKVIMEGRETNFGRQIFEFGWVAYKINANVVLEKDGKLIMT
ncbi:hypothetical protein PFICI_10346 [Pestalotiopsis fici W106-1]|uniref:F-box domain-containing protein n=1 Tax=Pestalotiopsis fici (strain W106-1 / CGMCC3.15140) TaxID=1229662 RepID=W3WWX3_PESFW|nr:uncharacterized protein PFICI_10346 [Pestalotiopsis fici W106-1]ETS78284.1 hypothetical protein PFICI_10346 [Pestalotiopsis fici W106-1]